MLVPSLRPGDLVIADIKLWHSSVPNTQATDRVLLQMIMQPATDGSYYPLSVPEPTLVAGNWRTDRFTPWEVITAATGSQLDKDAGMMGGGASATKADAAAPVAAGRPRRDATRARTGSRAGAGAAASGAVRRGCSGHPAAGTRSRIASQGARTRLGETTHS